MEDQTSSAVAAPLRPIAVLHLIHTVAYGGVETALLNWVRSMNKSRFTTHLVCFANPDNTEQPFVDAAAAYGLAVRRIPWKRSKPVWSSSSALALLLREESIQVLHTHNTYADLVGLVAARRCRVRTLTTLYVWSDFNWKRNLLQRFNRMLLPFFDLVSAHCEVTFDQTLAFGTPRDRLRLLTCGFEAPFVTLSQNERVVQRQARGAGPQDTVLINVARLYPEKEQKSLLEIFRQVRDRHPQAKLWIAGIGPLEAELRAHCTALELDECVSFLGFDADLPKLLALADIHVNTSSSEGVPLAICSAMAAALPIVATEVGGLPEILDHGRAGVLVPWQDWPCFVDRVSSLIQSPDLRTQYGQAARNFIALEYSLESAVDRLQQTYLELVPACV